MFPELFTVVVGREGKVWDTVCYEFYCKLLCHFCENEEQKNILTCIRIQKYNPHIPIF